MFVSVQCVGSLKANSTVSLFKGAGHCCWVEAELNLHMKQCQDSFFAPCKHSQKIRPKHNAFLPAEPQEISVMDFSAIALVGIRYASLCFKILIIVFFLIFCQFNNPVTQGIIIQIMF